MWDRTSLYLTWRLQWSEYEQVAVQPGLDHMTHLYALGTLRSELRVHLHGGRVFKLRVLLYGPYVLYAWIKLSAWTAHAFEAVHVTYGCESVTLRVQSHAYTFSPFPFIIILPCAHFCSDRSYVVFTICSSFSFRPSQVFENVYIQPMYTRTYSEF